MIDSKDVQFGDKVTYCGPHIKGMKPKYEHGKIKEVVDEEYVRVVYHCDNNWDQFENYTGAMTPVRCLMYGWI